MICLSRVGDCSNYRGGPTATASIHLVIVALVSENKDEIYKVRLLLLVLYQELNKSMNRDNRDRRRKCKHSIF